MLALGRFNLFVALKALARISKKFQILVNTVFLDASMKQSTTEKNFRHRMHSRSKFRRNQMLSRSKLTSESSGDLVGKYRECYQRYFLFFCLFFSCTLLSRIFFFCPTLIFVLEIRKLCQTRIYFLCRLASARPLSKLLLLAICLPIACSPIIENRQSVADASLKKLGGHKSAAHRHSLAPSQRRFKHKALNVRRAAAKHDSADFLTRK